MCPFLNRRDVEPRHPRARPRLPRRPIARPRGGASRKTRSKPAVSTSRRFRLELGFFRRAPRRLKARRTRRALAPVRVHCASAQARSKGAAASATHARTNAHAESASTGSPIRRAAAAPASRGVRGSAPPPNRHRGLAPAQFPTPTSTSARFGGRPQRVVLGHPPRCERPRGRSETASVPSPGDWATRREIAASRSGRGGSRGAARLREPVEPRGTHARLAPALARGRLPSAPTTEAPRFAQVAHARGGSRTRARTPPRRRAGRRGTSRARTAPSRGGGRHRHREGTHPSRATPCCAVRGQLLRVFERLPDSFDVDAVGSFFPKSVRCVGGGSAGAQRGSARHDRVGGSTVGRAARGIRGGCRDVRRRRYRGRMGRLSELQRDRRGARLSRRGKRR